MGSVETMEEQTEAFHGFLKKEVDVISCLPGGFSFSTYRVVTKENEEFVLKKVGDEDDGNWTYEAALRLWNEVRMKINENSVEFRHTEIIEYFPSLNNNFIHNNYALARFFTNSIDLAKITSQSNDPTLIPLIQKKIARSLGEIHLYSKQATFNRAFVCGSNEPEIDSAVSAVEEYLEDLKAGFSQEFKKQIEDSPYLLNQWETIMSEECGLPSILRYRAPEIDEQLEKILVHTDYQMKNILINSSIEQDHALISTLPLKIIDIDSSYLQCRLWDFLFLLVGGDELYFTTGRSIDEIETNFINALREYLIGNNWDFFNEKEIKLIINVLQIRLAHLLWHFGCNIPHVDRSFDYFIEVMRVWVELIFDRRDRLRDMIMKLR